MHQYTWNVKRGARGGAEKVSEEIMLKKISQIDEKHYTSKKLNEIQVG